MRGDEADLARWPVTGGLKKQGRTPSRQHEFHAAEEGKRSLELSTRRSEDELRKARERAAEVIAQAERRAAQKVDEAKNAAREEGNREKAAAKAEIAQEITRAREQLRDHVASLAVAGAEKILRREVDSKAHADLLDSIKRQL